MTRILITGVAGLVGSQFAKYILKNHSDVHIIGVDDLSGGLMENIPEEIYPHDSERGFFVEAGIGCVDEISEIFYNQEIDIVFHAACYAAECLSPFIRTFNYQNNLVDSANLLNLSIDCGVKRFVFCSSNSVYGDQVPPFDETLTPSPKDPYAISKYAFEMDLKVAHEQHGLDYSILRLHNIYGAGQNCFDPYRNVIGIFLYKARIGDPLTVFGTGEQIRAFSYIDDVLPGLWKACVDQRSLNQIINLGGIKQHSVLEAAHIVQNITNAEIIHLPPRYEVAHAFPTWQKSIDLLDFEHRTDLHDGISKMWQWFQTIEMRPRKIWPEYELKKGLYPQWQPENLKDGVYKAIEV